MLAALVAVAPACGKLPWKSTSHAAGATGGADANGFSCQVEKSPVQFMTTLTQDLFRRGPNATELAMATASNFDQSATVDWAFNQEEFANTGVAYFVSNLLRIEENLKPVNANNATEVALITDLKQEPVVFVQRNLDQPWSTMFTSQDFFCSALTGPLYDYPVDGSTSGFVSCKMGIQRAGLLGMVSVLRAYSSAFYLQNNNYHRNALAVYLSQGLELAAATNGPKGTGRPPPLPDCVPEIDTRAVIEKDGSRGLVYGTAAVPESGPFCAGCHVPYHAEMVAGFLRFAPDGSILQVSDIDKLSATDTLGVSSDLLKAILEQSGTSCWSANSPNDPPELYEGNPGLGRLIAASPKLPSALAIQIQQNWMNTTPVAAATAAVVSAYQANGGTLKAALKGYLLSDPYTCSKPNP